MLNLFIFVKLKKVFYNIVLCCQQKYCIIQRNTGLMVILYFTPYICMPIGVIIRIQGVNNLEKMYIFQIKKFQITMAYSRGPSKLTKIKREMSGY